MEKVDEPNKKLKYPVGVFFIVYNGLSDRFAYYGIKAVLILYLTKMLLFEEDKAKETYHLFFMFCTLIPVFGASIADSFVGKFKTILIFTVIYIVGNAILVVAAIPPLQLPQTEISILGLALLAIGTGCVKPCVVAFGGDQFALPEQEKQLSSYFSVFYFSISAGSLVATFLTPIFRKDVSCFGDDCYSLVFASTTTMMLTALIAFLIGKSFYKTTTTDGSVIVQVTKCITHAAAMKYKKGKSSTELHWLDHAATSGKFERSLVEDIKSVLKVLILYPTFPLFWALMEQQGSSWTLQASRMDGSFFGFEIKPDHIQVINPLLVLALIPAFDRFVYPALGKFNLLKKPLQKLGVGGVLAAISFVMAGFIQLHLEANQPGISQMIRHKRSEPEVRDALPHNFNPTWLPNVSAATAETSISLESASLASNSRSFSDPNISRSSNDPSSSINSSVPNISMNASDPSISINSSVPNISMNASDPSISISSSVSSISKSSSSTNSSPTSHPLSLSTVTSKTQTGYKNATNSPLAVQDAKSNAKNFERYESFTTSSVDGNLETTVTLIREEFENLRGNNNSAFGHLQFEDGNRTLNGSLNKATNDIQGPYGNASDLTEHSKIHMLWLIPQYITLTLAEVMFAVSGMEFSYSQAPTSMKSVMQSAWLVTIALGNLIVALVAKMKFFSDQSSEFFFFAILMLADMVIFVWLAKRFIPRNGFRKQSVKPYREIVSMSLRNHEVKKPAGIRRHTSPPEFNC